ncbi:hypothetical protein LTR84_002294 [Exophiala bonariae]|uniref:Dynactin subunit 6 n=1 Tax=Exophiala bonariae TaxID=1690606 RepID=A0AAV9NEH0_9EURO|nr:hypothetical protein LTR84_002294 [Exophiala bonariae]
MTSHSTTTTTTTTSTSKPPVTLPPSTHLDSGAYVRGTHAITLGEHNLVHARAQLVAIHGPLIISDRCIISEKCIVGGPVPATAMGPATSSSTNPTDAKPGTSSGDDNGQEDNDESDPVKTLIGKSVYMSAGSHVNAGATVCDAVILEPNVTVQRGVTVGAHSKICAGVTVESDVEDWSVVLGNGDVRRQRRRQRQTGIGGGGGEGGNDGNGDEDAVELIETMRLRAMDKEREGTVMIYRTNARMASLAKKK